MRDACRLVRFDTGVVCACARKKLVLGGMAAARGKRKGEGEKKVIWIFLLLPTSSLSSCFNLDEPSCCCCCWRCCKNKTITIIDKLKEKRECSISQTADLITLRLVRVHSSAINGRTEAEQNKFSQIRKIRINCMRNRKLEVIENSTRWSLARLSFSKKKMFFSHSARFHGKT